jgi:hypothetical protein
LHYWAKNLLNMLLYIQPSWYCSLLVIVGHLSSLDEALYSSNDRMIWCKKIHQCWTSSKDKWILLSPLLSCLFLNHLLCFEVCLWADTKIDWKSH